MENSTSDGSEYPLGYCTPDGELEVRVDPDADHGRCYHETTLGQHQRWMRQTPDLYELYQAALMKIAALEGARGATGDPTP